MKTAVKDSKKNKKKSKGVEKNVSATPTAPEEKKMGRPVTKTDSVAYNNLSNVPEAHRNKKVTVKDNVSHRVVQVEVKDVKAITMSHYVNDIHAQAPHIYHTQYWAIMPGHPHVMGPIDKDTYEFLFNTCKIESHLTVIDCSMSPTLSYAWSRKDVKGDFPTMDQIEAFDKRLKDNPSHFRNFPIMIAVKETQQEDEEEYFDGAIDDEEYFDLDEEQEEDTDEEADSWD